MNNEDCVLKENVRLEKIYSEYLKQDKKLFLPTYLGGFVGIFCHNIIYIFGNN